MKTELISLLLFAAPLMLQVMLSDGSSVSAPTAEPVGAETCSKEDSATAAKPAPKPALTSVKPAPAPAKAKSGPRIPAKLAPWLM